jgi:capsular exopolysaccharide synthesis family protein
MAVALGTGDSESLTVAQQSALQQFGQMQQKLSEIQFELMQSEGQLRVANELAERYAKAQEERSSKELEQEKVDMEAAINTMVDRSPDVARLRDEVDMLQGKVLAMSQSYGSAFPAYKIAKQDLDYKQKLLDDRREKARSSATEEVERAQEEGDRMRQRQEVDSQSRDMFANRSYDSIGLATRVEVLRNQEKLLVAKVDQLSNETRQLGRSSIDIELLRSEIKGLEDVLQRVGGEIERTSIELKTASRVRPISPASTATRPDFSKRITRSAALSLFGLFAPLMLLVGWDLSHRRIDSSESMSSALSIPTLGSIPKVSQRVLFRSPPAGHRLEAERVRVIESIDSIGSMVQFLARNDGSKVFLITSAIPSEGKSTIACQLADSLARSGNRVMLVDLDLRRPSIHRYLKLANDVGVTDVLEGRCQVSQAIQTTANDRMSILTAGTENENIQVLCTNGSVERMVAKLRDEYDFVIIDSCPILPVADTRSLVKFCDSVILTLVRDHSRLPLVSEAAAILRTYRARIIGGVIIGVGSIGYAKHYYSKSHNRPALETQSVSDESDAFAETK